ncbi:unnamed protein product [Choristocarpus tenellus]
MVVIGPPRAINREAVHLYRDILRATRLFHWCNEKGEPWNRILRESSRKEFEQARYERVSFDSSVFLIQTFCSSQDRLRSETSDINTLDSANLVTPEVLHCDEADYICDPLVVARLLVVGRQCLNDTVRGVRASEQFTNEFYEYLPLTSINLISLNNLHRIQQPFASSNNPLLFERKVMNVKKAHTLQPCRQTQ